MKAISVRHGAAQTLRVHLNKHQLTPAYTTPTIAQTCLAQC
jgi:hypothetical protein